MLEITNIIHDYISIIIVVAGVGVGYVIKNTPKINERLHDYIPLIVGVLGILLNVLQNGLGIEQAVIGLTSGLASTGLYEAYKNTIQNKKDQ